MHILVMKPNCFLTSDIEISISVRDEDKPQFTGFISIYFKGLCPFQTGFYPFNLGFGVNQVLSLCTLSTLRSCFIAILRDTDYSANHLPV